LKRNPKHSPAQVELKQLIETICELTGKKPTQIAIEAGYIQEQALTQAVSRKKGHEAVIKKLRLAFKDVLNRQAEATSEDNHVEPINGTKINVDALMQLISTNADAVRQIGEAIALTKTLAEANRMLAETNEQLARAINKK
jgi:hypothetical protein